MSYNLTILLVLVVLWIYFDQHSSFQRSTKLATKYWLCDFILCIIFFVESNIVFCFSSIILMLGGQTSALNLKFCVGWTAILNITAQLLLIF
jgi:hypothetical protein